MGATRKYAVIDPDTGKLDRRIFGEQAIYEEELEKIFGRAWLMIGHDSLVPAVDDFFQTYMGEDPVILTRDGEGRLHALLNMCRHRGNRVVRCDDGNAKRFMCTYHGWTYRNDGALEYAPGEAEAYYGALDKPSLGLIEARVGPMRGSSLRPGPRTPRASKPTSAMRAGISTPCSIGATAACRPSAR
jgi:phenylpropionate dioxygenase-like ring-hydroxylating dioxygenase large terminal subunit